MGLYEAPEGTEVSTVAADGATVVVRFEGKPRDVTDESVDATLAGLADTKGNPVKRSKPSRRKTSKVNVPKAAEPEGTSEPKGE